jgi:probable metal-binding protein
MESIHGHALMEWLGEKGPLSRESLLASAGETFGAQARFHTCSASDLSAEGLVDLLASKGKIGSGEQGLFLAMAPCDH